MNNLSLINKITKLIPSETIKKAVKETKHCFSDIELVQIIIEFAPSWEQMISLLGEMKKYTNDLKVRKYVSQYINIEKKKYKLLVTQEEGYIYEVVMDEKTNERYLVPDFNSAFITIESFLKHYKKYIEKNEYSRINIIKRKVSKRLNSREIDNKDEPVSCVLNDKKQIRRIYSYLNTVDLKKMGIEINEIRYPNVFNAGDLVYVDILKYPDLEPSRYYNYYQQIDNTRMYGINSFDNNREFEGQVDVCCFLELSSEYVIYRKIEIDEEGYCRYLGCHNHIDFGYLEKVDLNSLPEEIKKDYKYTKEELIKLNYINQ